MMVGEPHGGSGMFGNFVEDAIATITEMIEECEDPRVRWWLSAGGLCLLGGNVAFIAAFRLAYDVRILEAALTFAGSGILLFFCGLSLIRALVIAMNEQHEVPAAWKGWAFLASIAVVAVPAPLVLAAAGIAVAVIYRRRKAARSATQP
jgi:hypothetical protein